jgi:hypothetical protein
MYTSTPCGHSFSAWSAVSSGWVTRRAGSRPFARARRPRAARTPSSSRCSGTSRSYRPGCVDMPCHSHRCQYDASSEWSECRGLMLDDLSIGHGRVLQVTEILPREMNENRAVLGKLEQARMEPQKTKEDVVRTTQEEAATCTLPDALDLSRPPCFLHFSRRHLMPPLVFVWCTLCGCRRSCMLRWSSWSGRMPPSGSGSTRRSPPGARRGSCSSDRYTQSQS